MRITQWGEYGIHCAVYIAQRAQQQGSGNSPVGAADIAASQGIAIDYSQQILQRLRKGGIIESVRGPLGGYRLVKTPEQISIREILVAAEGETFEVICDSKPIGQERCSPGAYCGLREIWNGLKQHIDLFLNDITLAQLVERAKNELPVDQPPVQLGRALVQ